MLKGTESVKTNSINFSAISGGHHFTIVSDPERHLAFPDVCLTQSGQLLVVYRDGREHVDPSGRIMLVRGEYRQSVIHFESPRCVCDTDLDDRDPSIVELSNGSLLLNFFRLNQQTGQLYLSITLSRDRGRSWSDPRDIVLKGFSEGLATSDAVVQLPSGELVMAAYGRADTGQQGSYLVRSEDEGRTWPLVTPLATWPAPIFEEPAISLNSDGRLIACLRTDNRGLGFIYRTESTDEGYTWSIPERLTLWGYPADLVALQDGSMFVSYGYRQFPAGVRYCVARNGKLWSVYLERILRADGHEEGELGYPSAVELENGRMLVVYYYTQENSGGMPFIGATCFRLYDTGSVS